MKHAPGTKKLGSKRNIPISKLLRFDVCHTLHMPSKLVHLLLVGIQQHLDGNRVFEDFYMLGCMSLHMAVALSVALWKWKIGLQVWLTMFLWRVQVCLPMHRAQCKFGNLWQLRIQLMARVSAEVAFIKMRAAKLEGEEFLCKRIQVKENEQWLLENHSQLCALLVCTG
jgi:hypothetical protein